MDLVESEGEKKWSRRPAENGGTGEQGILRVEAGRVLWWWIVHGVLGQSRTEEQEEFRRASPIG